MAVRCSSGNCFRPVIQSCSSGADRFLVVAKTDLLIAHVGTHFTLMPSEFPA